MIRGRVNFFERIPNNTILLAIVLVMFLKIIIYVLIKSDILNISLGGGSDANYYNSYAEGYSNIAVNIWPVILRCLNDFGLYSRNIIPYLFFFLDLVAIPIITCKLANLKFKENQKHYLYIYLLCSIYPTLLFFTFDIYRDVFMVFSFLIGCAVVKSCLSSSNYLIFATLFIFSIIIGCFLLALRPYLGYAFLISLFLWKIKFTKKRVLFLGSLYILVLFIVNYVGMLEVLTEYRSGFEESTGGSTLGLNFSNPLMFIPNIMLSFLGQMLGLYVTNPMALVILLIETVPFLFMIIYVVKNIRFSDNFIRFLIIFFVIYASVWLIGNDNLGTALRLRFYNYFAIYISFFYILKIKKIQSKY